MLMTCEVFLEMGKKVFVPSCVLLLEVFCVFFCFNKEALIFIIHNYWRTAAFFLAIRFHLFLVTVFLDQKIGFLTSALDFSITLEAGLTFTHKVGGQIATLCVLHASSRQGGVLTLVDVCALMAITRIAFTAWAKVRAQCISAIGKDITRPIFALVVVGHVATFSPISIVTVALTIQTRAVSTFTASRITTIIWKITNSEN